LVRASMDSASFPDQSDALAGMVIEATPPLGAAFPVRLDRAVAEGGIGVVYAATSPALPGRPLAVKALQARHAEDPGIVRRFEREATYALRLSHPNVVRSLG